MPQLGERKKGREIGHSQKTTIFEWAACVDCGKERWIAVLDVRHQSHLKNQRCLKCSHKHSQPKGADSISWKGGRYISADGYVMINISPSDFFFPMTCQVKKGSGSYVMEHRLVMARKLRRCLLKWEIVHQKNGIKNDNRPENLEITSSLGEHSREQSRGYRAGYQQGYFDGSNERISELEMRVTLLEAELVGVKSGVLL